MTPASRRTRLRRIAVVTGSRAEYGLLRSTMEAITRRRNLSLQLVVTGMHLLRRFGLTANEIVRDGWTIDARIRMQKGNDTALDQALALSRGVAGIARFLEKNKTDIVLVLGDRIEAMAGALAAVTTGRILAHIHGGDVAPGDFDDSLRHAITKLAHVHLTATEAARRRVIRMGESPDRVFRVGAPGLDRLRSLTRHRGRKQKRSGKALIVQHPTGRSAARERKTMTTILHAVEAKGLTRTIVYPNTDRGHSGIVQAIEAHRRRCDSDAVCVFRSLERDAYLHALLDADVLVGNSSSGMIEAATAGTPTVNIGDRQRGRQPAGRSVIHADETPASLDAALERALRKRPITARSTVYGSEPVGPKIAAILAATPLHQAFRRKASGFEPG